MANWIGEGPFERERAERALKGVVNAHIQEMKDEFRDRLTALERASPTASGGTSHVLLPPGADTITP